MPAPYAFVSLVTSDHYLPGALALAAALKDLHPTPPTPPEVDFQTLCIVTPEAVDVSTIKLLRRAFDVVVGVELIEQEDEKGLQLLGRPDLTHVLTKLHVFRLTQYTKIIFLDADVLPIRPLSHLFTIPHEFAAVPDVGWPDIFNSGVLVLTPGQDKFNDLTSLLLTKGTWDGGDQGLLNEWRGGDWHRLSFTYNTTPTAAYTYAPAYERFGSQISAIHFIGPHKPWSSIPFRAPGTKNAGAGASAALALGKDEAPRTQAYDFDSLVDRWYDVYDRHYRSDAPTARAEFEVRRYASVWDGGSDLGAELPPLEAAGTVAPPGGVLGLEDLRRIAVEGMSSFGGSVSETEQRPKEGEYHSMPLEGRVDLMRPKREPPPEPERQESETGGDQSHEGDRDLTPRQEEYKPLEKGEWRMETLPTPGPNELPPAPYHRGHAFPQGESRSPPHSPSHAPPHHGQQPQQHTHSHPDHSHSQHRSSQPQQHSPSHSPSTHSPQRQHHHHHHHHHHSPPRPPSPPKLSWNPAIEPPPNNPPSAFAFPTDTYFPNVWDQAPSQYHDATHQSFPPHPLHVPAPHSDAFFNPPPPTHIPEHLVRQGQYANVIGHLPQHGGRGTPPEQPTPDRSKVHAVFPWEEKPRHVPRRVFPASDSPPPVVKYIEDEVPKPATPPPGQEQEQQADNTDMSDAPFGSSSVLHMHTAAPPLGLPGNLAYANAWDTVPSIQRYASRLVRPHQHQFPFFHGHHPHHPHSSGSAASPGRRAPWNDDEGWKRWEREREAAVRAKQDASSMDGDDEDEGDDDDSLDGLDKREEGSGTRGSASTSASGSGSTPKRSRAGSAGSAGSAGKGKKYRARGVQTIIVETRSQGVQVNTFVQLDAGAAKAKDSKPAKGGGGLVVRRDAASSPSMPTMLLPSALPPAPVREYRMDAADQMGVATPVVSHALKQHFPFPPSGSPTGLRSPQVLGSPRTYSPPKSTPSPKLSRLSSPFSPPLARSSSNDTALTSSPSTQGPLATPKITPESTPVMGIVRRGGRVWDPARGVDVFKRDSEEVLARFLRMGSFEEDERRQVQPEQ
ncbi:hypothetical protein IEO21_05264 [Rhodonia placenta]|uniref:glycogenin glucosyltransferase n=1 Tax=Rhodonia placenta TaxID=104341 RepID=A0A8H7U1T0_9APHY|nr:hypothetical protein IEO21_05264 [Postia placenta]